MAKKKDTDDEKFDADEDFGLPELHYEELNDDEDSSKSDETEEKIEEDSTDSATESPSEPVEDSGFYEEESFDEFKEDTKATPDSVFDSDSPSEEEVAFSSPSADSSPYHIGSEKTTESFRSYYEEDASIKAKSNFTKIVVIGTLLFISIAVVFVFMMDGDFSDFTKSEKPVVTIPEPEPEPVVEDTAFQQPVEEPQSGSSANLLPPGEITTLEQQTGKSYVIIGSFFDGDLAMDYAKVLAKNNKSPQIIPPFRDYRFYRVAIAEFNTFKDAEASAPGFAEEYGREAWPLKY